MTGGFFSFVSAVCCGFFLPEARSPFPLINHLTDQPVTAAKLLVTAAQRTLFCGHPIIFFGADFPVPLRLETGVETASMIIVGGNGITECRPIGGIVPD
jgi:hypothetical protein